MTEDIVRDLGLLTLGSRLKRIGENLQADTQRIMQGHGVTVQVTQYPYLAALHRDGALTVGEIAEAVGISQPGATRAVGQLADAGLVDISVSDDDQRRRQISLTDAGRDVIVFAKETVWPDIEAAVTDLCDGFGADLLLHLAAIEDGLAQRPLTQRTLKTGKSR
ncbi:MarR family winged helix-turn-helix transcriptional regulator [Aliirhizobium smilacinae]|uniref:MarR family transcriptional regulator n=1 Tax=Aliirhizobium smilacinae TaxID=1395944 RepID=A0A5C4XKB7_9HYPH|nr:MarR family transcriptional regulator [Rhizobium smilacinae]TNM62954.1 MarR family transcriptional regulator [Rhizobium smilacinae]